MTLAWRAVAAITILAACGDNAVLQPVGNAGDSRVLRWEIPLESNQSFDILFVIDDSPAMAPFATKLAGNERELIQLLTPLFGPDLHLGVVTADPADAGKLRETTSIAGDFLTTSIQFDFTAQTNVTGPIDDAFVALADVGAAGNASSQPLAMAQAALAPGMNPGFLRDDAFLGIVFLTAGDDSSPGAVADYVSALEQLKPDPTAVEISVASGPCSTGSLSAPDAPRLTELASQFPNRATQVAVCNDSLAELVSAEFRLIKVLLGAQCVDVPIVMPPECSFWLEHRATAEQRIIEPCPSSAIPCWTIVPAPVCSEPPYLSPELVPGISPESGVVEEIQCLVE